MMQYRRAFIPGGTYFFTVVTYERQKIFISQETVNLLHESFRHVLRTRKFQIVASVILPDHFHMIWTLPENDSDFPTRWRLIKTYFSVHYHPSVILSQSASRDKKQELPVWQRRYWEHFIRDETDLKNHVDYIHYNPVKHGFCENPIEWPYSSFKKFMDEGFYPPDWTFQASSNQIDFDE